ncbi:MAG TPA: ABC transporter permease [Clostridia bacterium]|nr:ABC transporter permease [Clostridia bacterium]
MALVRRNLLIFFRDKGAVFFSLLAVFIILGLYILFLGDMMAAGLGQLPGAKYLMDSWIMGGLLAVTPITASLGALGTMIDDRAKGIYKDFAVSPLKTGRLISGYLGSGILVGLTLTVLTFLLAAVYIHARNGHLPSALMLLKALGMIVFSTITSAIPMLYLISWFKSINAFATASTVLGTLIGFLTGIYIPIGSLPGPVQTVIKLFPPSHGALVFRRIMMEEAERLAFQGLPASALSNFRLQMGLAFQVQDRVLGLEISFFYLSFFTLLLALLTFLRFRGKSISSL